MARLNITETVLRDGNESVSAARMSTSDMVPILPVLDKIGYYAIEAWGGKTFEACLKYLKEDPWQRLRVIRANIHSTKLQMLLCGQSLVGNRQYPDDIVQYFVQKSIANGIDILRIYDPLNDVRNMEIAIRAAKKEKATVQAALCYAQTPAHTADYYVHLAQQLRDLGADAICIKDTAGVLKPFDVHQLIKTLKAECPNLPVHLHTHSTAGYASMTLLKAVEGGVDAVDTTISPFALGTSLPPTETIVSMLMNTHYKTELDTYNLFQASEYFSKLQERYLHSGISEAQNQPIRSEVLRTGIPADMYEEILLQLRNKGSENLLSAALREISVVRQEAGYAPLFYPISRIIGTQAVINVLSGKDRYHIVSDRFRSLVAGEYGKTPVPIDPAFQNKILGERIPITHRPADSLQPEIDKFRSAVEQYAEQEEDLLTLALFGQTAVTFFDWRKRQKYKLDPRASVAHATHPI